MMEESNLKEELMAIKTELKCWESMFTRKYKRKPTKEDIDNSSPEIQDSYKRYAKLKNSTKTPAKENIKDDGVFGQDLNKKSTRSSPVRKETTIKLDASLSWRPKLKPVKRPALNTADDNIDETSNELCKKVVDEPVEKGETSEMNCDQIIGLSKVLAQPGSLRKKNFDTKISPFRRGFGNQISVKRRHSLLKTASSIDWLESCKQSIEQNDQLQAQDGSQKQSPVDCMDSTKIFGSSCDLISEKDIKGSKGEENKETKKVYSIEELVGAQSMMPSETRETYTPMSEIIGNRNQTRISSMKDQQSSIPIRVKPVLNECMDGLKDPNSRKSIDSNDSDSEQIREFSISKLSDASVIGVNKERESRYIDTPVTMVNDDIDNSECAIDPPKIKGKRKAKKPMKDDTTENNDSSAIAKSQKRKRAADKEDELEVDKNTKRMKVSKKAASAKGKKLVSENFVKIDLRKKTYVRGLKKTSVSVLKRRAWKGKTAFELPTKTGKKTCFKCGGEGHWAKFCRGKPKQVDLFKQLDDEKASLQYKSLSEQQGSCFDGLYDSEEANQTPNLLMDTAKRFTMEDVMDIAPCWPRTPYIQEENYDLIDPSRVK